MKIERSNADEAVVALKNLTSCDTVLRDGKPRPLLRDINLTVREGERWGFLSSDGKAAAELLEIIGNMKPYYDGKAKVTPRGALRRKRLITEHLFYIDSADMLFAEMNVLEQLMLAASAHIRQKDIPAAQKKLLTLLVDLGLGYIALTPVYRLTEAEKLIVLCLLAAVSDSKVIALNAAGASFEVAEARLLGKVARYASDNGGVFLLAAAEARLAGIVCDHIVYIQNGYAAYSGKTDAFIARWDDVVCLIRYADDAPIEEIASLVDRYPACGAETAGDTVVVHCADKKKWSAEKFYAWLAANGRTPEMIKLNLGRIENSIASLRHEKEA